MRRISFGIILKTLFIFLVSFNAVFFAMPPISFAQEGVLLNNDESSGGGGITVGNEVIGGDNSSTNNPPGTGTVLQNNNNNNPSSTDITQQSFSASTPGLPICGIVPGGEGTVEGCFVRIFYYVLLYPSAWLASFAGQVFDWLIAFTLNATSYKNEFIEKGWAIIRDVINISFIFILLYTAIRFIVSNDRNSIGKTIAKIIMVAIVINFSLFVTRVIIDAGNILGRVLYEKMSVDNDDASGQTGYSTISAGLIGKVNPQKLLDGGMFQKKPTATGQESATMNNTLGSLSTESGQVVEGTEVTTGFIILILLMATVINILLIWIFISVGIFLIGRTIGLWIMMILSPIAFASMGIPGVSSLGGQGIELSFLGWIKQTFRLSFLVVIFLFLLYLVIMFLDTTFGGLQNQFTTNQSTIQTMMSVFIPMGIIFFLLKIAVSQAKSMSGSFGDIVGKGLKMAMIGALGGAGLALGGAAVAGGFLGRQTLGRAGASMANKDAKTSWGRLRKRTGSYLSKASFDTRNVAIPKPIGKVAGWGKSGLSYATGGALAAGDFNISTMGKGTADGGYIQRREKFVKEKLEIDEKTKPTEDTKIEKGHYYQKDPNTGQYAKIEIDLNMSVNEAKMNLERKKYEVKNNTNYEEKKLELKSREEAYAKAERDKKNGVATQADVVKARQDYETTKADIRAIEKQWQDEENKHKAAINGLGSRQSEHHRSYAESINSFDPRNRADDASGAVEMRAYQQDDKNEKREGK